MNHACHSSIMLKIPVSKSRPVTRYEVAPTERQTEDVLVASARKKLQLCQIEKTETYRRHKATPLADTSSHSGPKIIHLLHGSTETTFDVRLGKSLAKPLFDWVFTRFFAFRIFDIFKSFVQANLQS